MHGVNRGVTAVRTAQAALRCPLSTVPEDQVRRLFLSKSTHNVRIEVDADDAREAQRFVVGELGRLECVPGEYEPLGERIEIVLTLRAQQPLESPLFYLAPGGIECVLGRDG